MAQGCILWNFVGVFDTSDRGRIHTRGCGIVEDGVYLRIKEVPVPSARSEGNGGRGNEVSTTGPGPLFPLLLLAMLTSSIFFFLFSFQVHEKTILIQLLLLTLMMVGASGSAESMIWELGH